MNLINRKEYNVVEISRNKDFENMKKKECEVIVRKNNLEQRHD